MTLQDFVRETLQQIMSGVAEAKSRDKRISPWVTSAAKTDGALTTVDGTVVFLVEFDVAVTVTTKKEGSSGGSISIAQVFSAELGGSTAKEQANANRVRFNVPMRFNNSHEMAEDCIKADG